MVEIDTKEELPDEENEDLYQRNLTFPKDYQADKKLRVKLKLRE